MTSYILDSFTKKISHEQRRPLTQQKRYITLHDKAEHQFQIFADSLYSFNTVYTFGRRFHCPMWYDLYDQHITPRLQAYEMRDANNIHHDGIMNSLDIDVFHPYKSEMKPVAEHIMNHLIGVEEKRVTYSDPVDRVLKSEKSCLTEKTKTCMSCKPEITEINGHHQEISYKDKKVDLYHGTIGGIAKYHLPMVRMAYDGDDIKIMPSCLIYLLTGISVDYRWFQHDGSVLDIMYKYVDRRMLSHQVLHKKEMQLLSKCDISQQIPHCKKNHSKFFVTG